MVGAGCDGIAFRRCRARGYRSHEGFNAPHRSVDRPPREHQLNAEATAQQRLLDLQAKDTRLAQIAHRVKTLPEAVKPQVSEALKKVEAGVGKKFGDPADQIGDVARSKFGMVAAVPDLVQAIRLVDAPPAE